MALDLLVAAGAGALSHLPILSAGSEALHAWARENPREAWEWLRSQEGESSEWTSRHMLEGLARAAAITEPELAFEILATTGLDGSRQAVAGILTAAESADDRRAAMELFRERVAAGDIGRDVVLDAIASGFYDRGFEQSSRWIEDAALSREELARIAARVSYNQIRDGPGDWISFLARKLPGDPLKAPVKQMMSNWATVDHLAAGSWLLAAPDDAVKPHAVRGFAETVAPFEPATAEQWALTLPEGEVRDETLKSVYRRWPKNDPDGKSSFGNRHRISDD